MDVVVVGAGLAGLTAAAELHRAGALVRVVEARPRLGGRTLTVTPDGAGGASFDLGATWIWTDQPAVTALVAELGIATFHQHDDGAHLGEDAEGRPAQPVELAPAPAPALRLAGGAQQLCERLRGRLAPDAVQFGSTVVAIDDDGPARLRLTTDRGDELRAGAAVVALPPRLVLEKIAFTPPLPDELNRVMHLTPTWMARAIKCVAVYEAPFWRAAGLSGTAFSTFGPLREIHDGSPADGGIGALWAFFSGDDLYREMGPDERAEAAFGQLERLFGPAAGDPIQYFERDWSSDPNTNDEVFWVDEPELELGHSRFAEPHLGGRLAWAGAETISEGGGHMEGAVRSGRRAAGLLLGAP